MKVNLVPEGLRHPEGNPPYSLGAVYKGGEILQLAGVVSPSDLSIGDEVIAVMDLMFERVKAAGFEPDDIVHVRIIIVSKPNLIPVVTPEVNGAYLRAFNEEGVGISPESVLPTREAFYAADLIGGKAKFEAVATVFRP